MKELDSSQSDDSELEIYDVEADFDLSEVSYEEQLKLRRKLEKTFQKIDQRGSKSKSRLRIIVNEREYKIINCWV